MGFLSQVELGNQKEVEFYLRGVLQSLVLNLKKFFLRSFGLLEQCPLVAMFGYSYRLLLFTASYQVAGASIVS